MKLYWIITLLFNIAGAGFSFGIYVSPKGTYTNLVWLVLNIVGVYISWQVLKATNGMSNEKK